MKDKKDVLTIVNLIGHSNNPQNHQYIIRQYFQKERKSYTVASKLLLNFPQSYQQLQSLILSFSNSLPHCLPFPVPIKEEQKPKQTSSYRREEKVPYKNGQGNIYWWRNKNELILIRTDCDLAAVKKYTTEEVYLYAAVHLRSSYY